MTVATSRPSGLSTCTLVFWHHSSSALKTTSISLCVSAMSDRNDIAAIPHRIYRPSLEATWPSAILRFRGSCEALFHACRRGFDQGRRNRHGELFAPDTNDLRIEIPGGKHEIHAFSHDNLLCSVNCPTFDFIALVHCALPPAKSS